MRVYFTAAVTGDGEIKRYRSIISRIKRLGHTIVSGEQLISPEKLQKDSAKTPEEIFTREKQAIEKADCIIAEVTTPSSGVGGEIVWSLVHEKPVLALFYRDAENLLSPMIAGNPSEHLYLEHYEDDNIGIKLKEFLSQVATHNRRKGKLIVIDGGDGSGKATQSEMLKVYLMKRGMRVKYMDFPRYYSSFHGRIVGRFLSGEFGELNQVSPYLAALAYALDRASAKAEMDAWLGKGGVILSNRYATSSMAHQAARLPENQRKDFIDWVDELEYKVHKIPREDVVIYLHVPWEVGLELTRKKGDRKYLGGTGEDIQEKDIEHRKASEEMYLRLARERRNWICIECLENGVMLTKEQIHERVVSALKSRKVMSDTV